MAPIYFTESNNPLIEKYRDWFQKCRDFPDMPIDLKVSKHHLKHIATTTILEPLTLLQHFPDLLGQFALNVVFKFEKESGKGLYFKDYDWVSDKTIFWLNKLATTFPAAIFFIKDKEALMYAVLGDMFMKGKIPVRSLNSSMSRLYLTERHFSVIGRRLFTYSCFYYVFCLGSNFDPSESIKTVYERLHLICPLDSIMRTSELHIQTGNPYGRSNLN